jgi:hypothetical protein
LKKLWMSFVAVLLTASCGTKAPQPSPYPICGIVAVSDPYLYCQMSDNKDPDKVWRIKIKDLKTSDVKYYCTDDSSYADALNYEKRLRRWIEQSCK